MFLTLSQTHTQAGVSHTQAGVSHLVSDTQAGVPHLVSDTQAGVSHTQAGVPHLVVQLLVEDANPLLIFVLLLRGDQGDRRRGDVINDGRVITRLKALLLLGTQLLVLRHVLTCIE